MLRFVPTKVFCCIISERLRDVFFDVDIVEKTYSAASRESTTL